MSVDFVGTKFLDFRQVLHGTAGGMSPQVQARSQQLPGSTPVHLCSLSDLITSSYFSYQLFVPDLLLEIRI